MDMAIGFLLKTDGETKKEQFGRGCGHFGCAGLEVYVGLLFGSSPPPARLTDWPEAATLRQVTQTPFSQSSRSGPPGSTVGKGADERGERRRDGREAATGCVHRDHHQTSQAAVRISARSQAPGSG